MKTFSKALRFKSVRAFADAESADIIDPKPLNPESQTLNS